MLIHLECVSVLLAGQPQVAQVDIRLRQLHKALGLAGGTDDLQQATAGQFLAIQQDATNAAFVSCHGTQLVGWECPCSTHAARAGSVKQNEDMQML